MKIANFMVKLLQHYKYLECGIFSILSKHTSYLLSLFFFFFSIFMTVHSSLQISKTELSRIQKQMIIYM